MPYTTLIQAAELAALLRDAPARTLVCDCSFDLANHDAGRVAYEAGHIPGATYLFLEDVLSGPKTGKNGRHPLPEREQFVADMRALGVSHDTQVVAYDAADGMFASRLWFLMRWIGHANVAVLDGGLAAWRAAGLSVETKPFVARPRGELTAGASLVQTLDYAAVLASSASGDRLIVDARAPNRFRGEDETLDPIGGHIPNARNRFFRMNVTAENRFKPAEALRQEFEAVFAGRPSGEVVAQCGSGVTACHNLLAMEVAGLHGAALYPGSWSEWSARSGSPIATGAD